MSSRLDNSHRSILITGCSSGIGEACARQLAADGFRVFASVRQESDAQRLRDLNIRRIEPILFDVTCSSSVEEVAGDLRRAVGEAGLWGLVNNAGIVVPGPLELVSTAELRNQLEVNVLGPHTVTKAMLPLLRKARGRIVMIGSISGQITPPFYGAYSASKHALEAISDALRIELRSWGIVVSVVQPDSVATGIWSKLAVGLRAVKDRSSDSEVDALYNQQVQRLLKASVKAERTGLSTSAVVGAVQHALHSSRPRTRYRVGLRTRMAVFGDCWLPQSVMDWALTRSVGLNR